MLLLSSLQVFEELSLERGVDLDCIDLDKKKQICLDEKHFHFLNLPVYYITEQGHLCLLSSPGLKNKGSLP